MKYSYLWLKELSGTKKLPGQLADLLTMRAFELEEMKREGKETQLVFDVLANRGHDALSHIGMAREICAAEGRKFKSPSNSPFFKGGESGFPLSQRGTKGDLNIEIKDKSLCHRYIGAVLENIKVASSPKWMQERLLVSGVKPINNIVDITNYVMLETGQPLHAFDAEKTSGNIIVRKAKKGKEIKLLDENEKILNENDLIITDAQKALALAGVMGGFDSSITKKTKSIILESANFDATSIRKTRTWHNISTESSYRFERDIDPNLAEIAAARAIELLQKYGGKNMKVVAYDDVYPKKIKPWVVELDTNYAKSLLGENIPDKKIKNILENLGIVAKASKNMLTCEIPTVRIDLKTQEDLIEEIGRIYGYENIPPKAPVAELSVPPVNEKRVFEDKLRDILTGLGFSEMLNYSFYSKDDIEKCNLGLEGHYEVANPMNPDQQYMRRALIPGLLKNILSNQKSFEKIQIFEIGKKYRDEDLRLPKEISVLAGALVEAKNDNPFFTLKSKLEAFFDKLGCRVGYKVHKIKYEVWHPGRIAEITVNGRKIGKTGEISPIVYKKYGLNSRVAYFGISIKKLMESATEEKIFQPISKFPSVHRDISMFVPEKVKYADIESAIAKTGGKLVKNIELFDRYEKSIALRIEIGSREKTLTSAEIDEVMKKIIGKLERDLRVKVRK